MEPNGYTDEVANALFASFTNGKVGDALDGIAAIGYALSAIVFEGNEFTINDAANSSFDELAKAAWAMVDSFNSISTAINNHAGAMEHIAEEINYLAHVSYKNEGDS